jgi:hypothetical protein
MCQHRTSGRWGRIWTAYLVAFGVLEVAALSTKGGVPATGYLRRLGGLEPACEHGHLGRGALLVFLGWAALHLGWGLFGWRPRP